MRLTVVSILAGGVGLGIGLSMAGLSAMSAALVALGALALVALPILFLSVQTTVGLSKAIVLSRSSLAHAEAAQRATAKIAWHTATSRATASSVGRMAPTVRAIDRKMRMLDTLKTEMEALQTETQSLRKIQQHLRILREEAEIRPGRTEALGPFAPAIVQSSKVTAQRPGVVGRVAAARPDDAESGEKLARLLETDFETTLPMVSVIGTPQLVEIMEPTANVHSVYPTYGTPSLPTGTSYLVVEDRALTRGPWAGASQATGTLLFRDIYNLLRTAREDQIVVVYLESGEPPGHFTMSIKNLATVTLRSGVLTGELAADRAPTFLRTLATTTAQGGRA